MATQITDGFSPGDDEKAVSLLKKWKGGPLSNKLFVVLAGMVPSSGVVTVIIRRSPDLEILLVPRPHGDIVWPGMLNLPGTQFRAADWLRTDSNPLNGALERIQEAELKTELDGNPEFAGVSLHSDDRGPQVVLVYLAKVDPNHKFYEGCVWYNVEKLDELKNFVKSEIKSIKVAVDYYQKGFNL